MPMKPACAALVQRAAAALGHAKPLTAAQIDAIDQRLRSTMRQLARTDPLWQTKTPDQRITEASTRAMQDVQAEAARKVANAQLQIVKTVATENRIQEQLRLFDNISRSKALTRDMANIENGINGLKAQAMSRLIDLIEASKSGKGASAGRRALQFLFDADNPQMTRDLAHEIYTEGDGSSGNKLAADGAKAWIKTIDELRQRFNNAGGDIGKLDYGFVPIAHDFRRVRGTNDPVARDAWVSKVLGLVDRARYVDEAGAQVGTGELTNMLGEVWKTIASDGLNKTKPGEFKSAGARANRGAEHRVLHFKDGESYLQYMSTYGKGSMYDLMTGHVGKMAKDIGLVEGYGPNPNSQMRLQLDLAARHDGGELQRVGFGIGIMRASPDGVWRTLSGEASTPKSEIGAAVFSTIRNVQGLKLAGTFLKMFPDLLTYFASTGFNKLGYWNALASMGRSTQKDIREWAAMHGLMADSAMRELNRFMGENIGSNWSARLSNSQMKLSLGEAWTNWLDRAYGLAKMGALGRLASKDWAALPQWDRVLLERSGITDADWAVVRAAKPDVLHGMDMLTPDSILGTGHADAAQVADKILGVIRAQVGDAVVKADLLTRTAATWNGMQAGTGAGEFARAVMQFKSFPMAMITRHWDNLLNAPKVTDGSAPALANPLLYAGALGVGLTAFGAISLQATQIASGKDPIDMTGPHAAKFWAQAFATGGAGGFYSDLLMRNSAADRSPSDVIGNTLGPSISDLSSVMQITKGNIDRKLAGKDTHAAAEGANFARSHIPYVNLWYAKAALDHAGMHALQENMSPGYLGKMKQRAQQDWGQSYWWQPGTGGPQRAPDIGKAVGQ